MGKGITGALRASPTNQLRLKLYQGRTGSESLVRLLSPYSVAEWWIQFIFNKVVGQTRSNCHDKNEKQAEPERSIAVHLELHAIVVALRKEVEHELGVKCEVEHKVKDDTSPNEKVINPRPVLREKRDLTRTTRTLLKLLKGFPRLFFAKSKVWYNCKTHQQK